MQMLVVDIITRGPACWSAVHFQDLEGHLSTMRQDHLVSLLMQHCPLLAMLDATAVVRPEPLSPPCQLHPTGVLSPQVALTLLLIGCLNL